MRHIKKIILDILIGISIQIREKYFLILILYLTPIGLLVIIYLIGQKYGINVSNFMKDPVSIGRLPFYSGIISNLGVFWFASSIVCLFTSILLMSAKNEANFSRFFFYFGLLTLLLMFDDLMLLHEQVLPDYIGTSEKLLYFIYIVLLIAGSLSFQKTILKTNFLILLIGACFLALSIAVDLFQERIEEKIGSVRILFEDGFKFIGIVGWFGYFSNSAFLKINELIIAKK